MRPARVTRHKWLAYVTISIDLFGAAQFRKLWRRPRSWSASARASAPQARLPRRCRRMPPAPNTCNVPCEGCGELLLTQWREAQAPRAQAAALPPHQELAPPQPPPVRAAGSAAAAASAPQAVGASASAQARAAASKLPDHEAADSRPCQPPMHAEVAAQQPMTQHASGLSASQASPPRRAQEGGPSADPEEGHRSGGGGSGWGGFSGVLALGGSGDGGRRPAGPRTL